MAAAAGAPSELQLAEDTAAGIAPADLKIILLGDSAVGKSKLIERFLINNYHPRQRSTFALTLYRHEEEIEEEEAAAEAGAAAGSAAGDAVAADGAGGLRAKRRRKVAIDFWDTAGQERFASMHASYYFKCAARPRTCARVLRAILRGTASLTRAPPPPPFAWRTRACSCLT